MSVVSQIKSLLEQGEYLEADKLANDLKITRYQSLTGVNDIASMIQQDVDVLSTLEAKIKGYESMLRNVKDTAFQMEEKEHAVQVQCKNLTDTCELIQDLLDNLKIDDSVQVELLEGNLSDEQSIERISLALSKFEKVLRYKPDKVIQNLKCVRDQKEHAKNIKSKFSERFYHYFSRFLDSLFAEFSENFINIIYCQAITLPEHDAIHTHIQYMDPLIQWLGKNDESVYTALNNFYIDRSKTQYDKELKIFFECTRERMSNPSMMRPAHLGRLSELSGESRKRNSMSNTGDSSSTRASSLSGGGGVGGVMDTQDAGSVGKGSDISYTGWEEFDAYIDEILNAIEPTCLAEQQFYSSFFPSCNPDVPPETMNRLLEGMFGVLKTEFIDFANFYNSQNGLYSLYLLVRLSQYLSARGDTNFFLLQVYKEIRICVKRNFDNFMDQQLTAIRDLKAPKQSKCGVLSVVRNFEQFAKQVESLFKSIKTRRSDIDRWYPELVTELFRIIDRIEHNKTPTEMIRLENYNYLHDVLRSIKVPYLEAQRKEANLQYKSALNSYVARYFGRPLEKVNIFFEGVQSKVAQGVKEEEVSFQLAFSKQELRKVLNMVTLKEVRKGLEEMYRRIEKHASEPDSNLIQVVWHAMQDEFLSQYKAIQGMIERCYPSSNLSLTFTIDDVLQVFSDIAQSH